MAQGKDSNGFLNEILGQNDPEIIRQMLLVYLDSIYEQFFLNLGGVAANASASNNHLTAVYLFELGSYAAQKKQNVIFELEFLIDVGFELSKVGEPQKALNILSSVVQKSRALAQTDDKRGIRLLTSASQRLALIEIDRGNYEGAQRLLNDIRGFCYEIHSNLGEIWANLNLALNATRKEDFDVAKVYVSRIVQIYGEIDTADTENSAFPPPDKNVIYSLLNELAFGCYYKVEDFESAAFIAELAINLMPEEPGAYYFLGNSQFRLEKFEDACQTWKKAVLAKPDFAPFYINYGASLTRLGHREPAIEAYDRAIEISPTAKYFWFRGEFFQNEQLYDKAILDFTRAIELGRQQISGIREDEEPSSPPQSKFAYEQNMPIQDIVDFARIERIKSYQALGQNETALEDARELIEHGDDPARYAGYRAQGEIHQTLGEHLKALDAFSAALKVMDEEHQSDVRILRAKLYIFLEQTTNAIGDLAFVAQRDRDPKASIQELTKMLEKYPDHPQVLKWRGYAYQELGDPLKAEEDLNRAIKLLPDDADLYLWRGISRMLFRYPETDEDWTNEWNRIPQTIVDLAIAVVLNRGSEKTIRTYNWVVDRVSADPYFFNFLLFNRPLELSLPNVNEKSREPIRQYLEALDLALNRKWQDATAKYRTAQAGFIEAGLPLFATRLALHLADAYLRLYDLQLATDYLLEAEKLPILRMQPLSENLQSWSDKVRKEGLLQYGREPGTVEIDYLMIVNVGGDAEMAHLILLRAELLSRKHEYRKAVEELGKIDELIPLVDRYLGFQALIGIVKILKDAEEYSQATTMLETISSFAKDDESLAKLYHSWGVVLLNSGDLDSAQGMFQKALSYSTFDSIQTGIKVNLSAIELQRGHFSKALEILNQVNPAFYIQSLNDELIYNNIKAQIFAGLGLLKDAKEAALASVAILNDSRQNLRTPTSRMNWQLAQWESAFVSAITLAIMTVDILLAFELSEMSRSRTFLDILHQGYLPLPEEASQYVTARKNSMAKRGLLIQLSDILKVLGKDYVDFEVLGKLKALDNHINVTTQVDEDRIIIDGVKLIDELDRVNKDVENMDERIEQAQFTELDKVAGKVISFIAVKNLLIGH